MTKNDVLKDQYKNLTIVDSFILLEPSEINQ